MGYFLRKPNYGKRIQRAIGRSPNFDPIVFTLPDQAQIFLMRIPQEEINNNNALNAGDQNP